MTLQEFIAARVGTRFFAVTATGHLTRDAKMGGASRAISHKLRDKLECAWKRGETPSDKLSEVDLRLLRKLAAAPSCQIIRSGDGTFYHPATGTIERRRLARWRARSIIEPLQLGLFKDVAASFTVTPKGLRIGAGGAPHA